MHGSKRPRLAHGEESDPSAHGRLRRALSDHSAARSEREEEMRTMEELMKMVEKEARGEDIQCPDDESDEDDSGEDAESEESAYYESNEDIESDEEIKSDSLLALAGSGSLAHALLFLNLEDAKDLALHTSKRIRRMISAGSEDPWDALGPTYRSYFSGLTSELVSSGLFRSSDEVPARLLHKIDYQMMPNRDDSDEDDEILKGFVDVAIMTPIFPAIPQFIPPGSQLYMVLQLFDRGTDVARLSTVLSGSDLDEFFENGTFSHRLKDPFLFDCTELDAVQGGTVNDYLEVMEKHELLATIHLVRKTETSLETCCVYYERCDPRNGRGPAFHGFSHEFYFGSFRPGVPLREEMQNILNAYYVPNQMHLSANNLRGIVDVFLHFDFDLLGTLVSPNGSEAKIVSFSDISFTAQIDTTGPDTADRLEMSSFKSWLRDKVASEVKDAGLTLAQLFENAQGWEEICKPILPSTLSRQAW